MTLTLNLTKLLNKPLNIFGQISASSINARKADESSSLSEASFRGGKMLSRSGMSGKNLGCDFLGRERKNEVNASRAAMRTYTSSKQVPATKNLDTYRHNFVFDLLTENAQHSIFMRLLDNTRSC
jgi:hypothetical protein